MPDIENKTKTLLQNIQEEINKGTMKLIEAAGQKIEVYDYETDKTIMFRIKPATENEIASIIHLGVSTPNHNKYAESIMI